jgi:hypothetical protein
VNLGKYIRTLGYILLAAGAMFILGGQIRVLWQHGVGALLQMVSPRNLAFYAAAALILGPGAMLIVLGEWLDTKRRRRRRRTSYLTD